MKPADFANNCRFATEALRRWQVSADWLAGEQPADNPALAPESRLRRLRQLGALRILWQEVAGRHDVEQTGERLSALACECLCLALTEAERRVAERHGTLSDAGGDVARLGILALGKLGGDELNFNSDLDLVFCHDAVGHSDGRRPLEPRDYFTRVVRELSRLMEQVTAEGRVWVLDTRLRPFGQAGALVWSVSAMEQYFLAEGRTWERYAWLKARAVAGDVALGERLIDSLRPFVFRRYLDYGLFDSLRDLHADIDRRSRRDDLAQDIKRGPGGIRELEFLIQSLQLLRGGNEPGLRRPGFLRALRAARRARLLDAAEAREIDSDYRYLRRLENLLQCVTGRQTHELPESESVRDALARVMGHSDRAELDERIEYTRARVRERFRARFEARAQSSGPGISLWPPQDDLAERLAELGFDDPAAVVERIGKLQKWLERRTLSAEARRRLDRLMPELLDQVLQHRPPDTGLSELLDLVETIARRSAYLALLHERPGTLDRCVRVFRRSRRVAGWIIASPQLLDDLLAPDAEEILPPVPALPGDDIEAAINALARFRQAGFVHVALAQLDGTLDRAGARGCLTRLAELVLEHMAGLFLAHDAAVAIIGYGNLGAGELHFTSDLDLVFLHDQQQPPPVRAVQRLINAMQMPQVGGKLYEVDTRLRPNGNSGMLVSSLDSFADYQARHAWTWEHQALIRARCVFGPEQLRESFEQVRAQVLAVRRERAEVTEALAEMRRRQLDQRRESDEKRLLGDIQFIAELGLLLQAHRQQELLAARSTPDLLRLHEKSGWLSPADARALAGAFDRVAELRDRLYLERGRDEAPDPADVEAVAGIWQRCFNRVN